jgi:hypothetical protein
LVDGQPHEVVLKVEKLTNDDRQEFQNWIETPRESEVVYDLENFLYTGLQPGEYGYKLVDPSGAIEGFVVLLNTEGHLHLHIVFANPLRRDTHPLKGVGRALTQLAILDALKRNIALTTFPMTPDSQRTFLSMDFERLAAGGTLVTDTWCLRPEKMRDLLDHWDDPAPHRLPPVGSVVLMSALRSDRSSHLTFHDVAYETLDPILLSRRLYERFASDPEALYTLVSNHVPIYFDHQDKAPNEFFILDTPNAGQSIDILTVEQFKHRTADTQALLSPAPQVPIKDETIWPHDAVPSDLPELLRFREDYYVSKTYSSAPTAPEALLKLIINEDWPGAVMIGKDSNKKIQWYTMGYLHPALGYGEIEEMALNPAQQGLGHSDVMLVRASGSLRNVRPDKMRFTTIPVKRIFMEDESIRGRLARRAYRRGWKRYPGLDRLWYNGKDPDTTTSRRGWRGFRPGFEVGDPRRFPGALVPKLLKVALDYREPKDHEKAIEIFTYILRYRPLDVRVIGAWGWTIIRRWIQGIFAATRRPGPTPSAIPTLSHQTASAA